MKWFRLDGTVSLRLDLGQAARAIVATPAGWTVREVTRDELLARPSPELPCSVPALDEIAAHGWRCFAAFDGERPIHRSFIEPRPGRPLLFGAMTRPDVRGRGAFRATVAHLARVLGAAGEETLISSTSRSNRASVRAHRAAGFVIHSQTMDPVILGVSLRAQARRLLGGYGPTLRSHLSELWLFARDLLRRPDRPA